jgi:hypothetical protein
VPIGLGESNQAAFTLRAAIPAGTWHLVGDGEGIVQSVDVRFDIVWRHGGSDAVLATVTHSFAPNPAGPGQFDAVGFEADLPGMVAAAAPGDPLILRFTTVGGAPGAYYIPNGDGAFAKGRDPNLSLP